MSDRVDRCETCRFWDNVDDEVMRGECHRYPGDEQLVENIGILLNLRDAQRSKYEHSTEVSTPFDNVEIEPGILSESLEAELFSWVRWKTTLSDDWCGEWQPAKQPANVITIYYLQ